GQKCVGASPCVPWNRQCLGLAPLASKLMDLCRTAARRAYADSHAACAFRNGGVQMMSSIGSHEDPRPVLVQMVALLHKTDLSARCGHRTALECLKCRLDYCSLHFSIPLASEGGAHEDSAARRDPGECACDRGSRSRGSDSHFASRRYLELHVHQSDIGSDVEHDHGCGWHLGVGGRAIRQ